LSKCSKGVQVELKGQLGDYSAKADTNNVANVLADPKNQFSMMMEMMLDMQSKLSATVDELNTLRSGGGKPGGGGSPRKSRSTAKPVGTPRSRSRSKSASRRADEKEGPKASGVDKSRKGSYRFGNAKVNFIKPSEGYPNARDALDKPSGSLVLEYAHGYQGREMYGRGNMFYVSDEKSQESALVYHVAGVGVVLNTKDRTQNFFTGHNDDITCLAVSAHPARPNLVATGQTDPKDFGEKDMPKIMLWDWTTMKRAKLIPDAHWGMVLKVQFSAKDDLLFSIGGEEEHLLKVWSLANIKRKGKAGMCKELMNTPTVKEDIYGFSCCPYKLTGKFKEEFLIFGRKKGYWAGLQAEKKGFSLKLKSILFSLMKEVKESKGMLPKAVLSADWLPNGKFVVGDNLGAMYVCHQTKPLCRVMAHKGPLGALTVTKSGMVITGGNDGHLKTWTVNPLSTSAKMKWSTSKQISFLDNDFEFLPRAIAYDEINSDVYVGSKTCQIMSLNLKSGDSKIVIDGHDDQVWGLTTCNKEGFEHYYITGGFDGVMKIWDCKERDLIDTYEFEQEDGKGRKEIVSCIWSNDGMLVAAGSEDGFLYLFTWFENRALELVAQYEFPVKKGREAEGVSYLRFSEDDEILAVAHMDANLYCFTLTGHGKKWTLEPWKAANHRAAPTHIQWSADSKLVKVLTRDYEVAHWLVNREIRSLKFYPHQPDPDDVKWAGDPLVAGWDVQGCYQAEWDGTDLNDVTLSGDGHFLVAGDDFGMVRMYKYPAVSNKKEAHRCYLGHSSFVVGVEFCRDDKYLITCGGNDMAIFQWRLEKY
jgi:WD40 repeat protein